MGNGQLALSPDEYIMATLNIYLVGGGLHGVGYKMVRVGRAEPRCMHVLAVLNY